MSSRKLRKLAGELLKKNKFPKRIKQFKSPRMNEYYFLKSGYLNAIIRYFSFGPGDVINDCDGFNHVIKDYERDAEITGYNSYIFTDGDFSCSCGRLEKAKSAEEITKLFLEVGTEEIKEKIKAGVPICTEEGFKL